ncbi:MAG: NUDIX domain-containing protein [Burkholderiaceae bacterium]
MTLTEIEQLLADYRRHTLHEMPEDRLPFEIEDRVVGSVSLPDAQLLSTQVPGVELSDDALSILPICAPDAPAVLQAMALVLRDNGRSNRWRDEDLPVCADDGTLMGKVERGCSRPLGIRTFAVHLIGCVEQPGQAQSFWLQRRAPDKDVDPGMLDTLAGGLVGMNEQGNAMEAFVPALAREVEEEAGLTREQYAPPVRVGSWRIQAPVEGGYMVEDLLVWRAAVNPGCVPANQDGEVSEFLLLTRDELVTRLRHKELTREASIASLMCLKELATSL